MDNEQLPSENDNVNVTDTDQAVETKISTSDDGQEQEDLEDKAVTENSTVNEAPIPITPSSSLSSAPSTPTLSTKKTTTTSSKIDVVLKPVGDAPILKQKRWSVDPDKPVGTIVQFIKNYLRLPEADQNLFVFVNQAFAPSPDQLIRNLYDCFGSDGKLILHYSTTVAWG